jgi:hypothetical protein
MDPTSNDVSRRQSRVSLAPVPEDSESFSGITAPPICLGEAHESQTLRVSVRPIELLKFLDPGFQGSSHGLVLGLEGVAAWGQASARPKIAECFQRCQRKEARGPDRKWLQVKEFPP